MVCTYRGTISQKRLMKKRPDWPLYEHNISWQQLQSDLPRFFRAYISVSSLLMSACPLHLRSLMLFRLHVRHRSLSFWSHDALASQHSISFVLSSAAFHSSSFFYSFQLNSFHHSRIPPSYWRARDQKKRLFHHRMFRKSSSSITICRRHYTGSRYINVARTDNL